MLNRDIEDLKNISKRIKQLNAKIKLIALLEKAHKEFEQNNLSNCEETCKEILKTDPENTTALRGLGCIMQARNNLTKALEYYNRALVFSNSKEIEYTLSKSV